LSLSPQLEGIEQIEGTYLFDLERSAKSLRLNRFMRDLGDAAKRELYKKTPEAAFEAAALTPEERRMVRDLDWRALIRYGCIFFCMEKLARVNGISNPEMVAHMRGESLEDFLKTRRVPGAR
jgi:gallate dioxygenase